MEDFLSWLAFLKDFFWKIFLKMDILEMKNVISQRKISLDGINSSYILQKKISMYLKAKQ